MMAKNKGNNSMVLFMFYRANNSSNASNIAPLTVKILQRKPVNNLWLRTNARLSTAREF
jgi:hypothetical protein